ncbi:hypothetical protein AMTRI_Chr04g247920 [Amborella trichopoda]
MDATKISQLKLFIEQCRSNPTMLRDPSLGFFRDYLERLGAKLPASVYRSGETPSTGDVRSNTSEENDYDLPYLEEEIGDLKNSTKQTEKDDLEDVTVESDVALDDETVAPDNDPPQKMGDPSVEVTDEMLDAAQMAKAKAMAAVSEGNLNEAIEHMTEAIISNPNSAILYATRASIFVKMKKPNAAIRDADAALKINPDFAKGFKSRGMAKAMLGQWEDAAKDLHVASQLDYDEEIALALKRVEPNARKIEEHHKKYECLHKRREENKAKKHDSSITDPLDLWNYAGHVIGIHSARELETKFDAANVLSRLAILYFTAAWCGPCRFIAPVFEELASKYLEVVFLKVDIDELKEVAARWNISSVPTFYFIKNGKELDKVVGADKTELEKKIALHLGKVQSP